MIARTANWAINCLESFISVLLVHLMCVKPHTHTTYSHTHTHTQSLTIRAKLLNPMVTNDGNFEELGLND